MGRESVERQKVGVDTLPARGALGTRFEMHSPRYTTQVRGERG